MWFISDITPDGRRIYKKRKSGRVGLIGQLPGGWDWSVYDAGDRLLGEGKATGYREAKKAANRIFNRR